VLTKQNATKLLHLLHECIDLKHSSLTLAAEELLLPAHKDCNPALLEHDFNKYAISDVEPDDDLLLTMESLCAIHSLLVDYPAIYDLSINEIDQFLCSLQALDATVNEHL
jgi:hypothetical protein